MDAPPAHASRLLTAFAPPGPGPVGPGDRVASLIAMAFDRAGIEARDGDVLTVDARTVAAAAGRERACASDEDFAALVAGAGAEPLAARTLGGRTVSVVRVGQRALVDAGLARPASYPGTVVLPLPDAPAVATALAASLRTLLRARVDVVLTAPDARPGALPPALLAVGATLAAGPADAVAAAAGLAAGPGYPFAIVRAAAPAPGTEAAPGRSAASGQTTDPGHAADPAVPNAAAWFRPGAREAARAALGAPALAAPPPAGDGSDDVGARVGRAIATVRDAAASTVGEDAWLLAARGAGSLVAIESAPEPARSSAGGHPLLEATIGLGALTDRLLAALRIEGLHGTVHIEWGATGAPLAVRVEIGLAAPEREDRP